MRIRIQVARRRTTVIRAAAAAAALVVALPITAGASAATRSTLQPAAPAARTAVSGEIVVAFRSGADGSERAAARSAARVRAERSLLVPRAQLVQVERGQTVPEAITALEQRADVRYAEPNWIYHESATTPDDPRFGSLWGLSNTGQTINGQAGTADADIDAPEAWDVNRGSASTVVAVVDSGVAWEHPDLAPNIWRNPGEIPANGIDDDANGQVDDVRGWDVVGGDNDPWDYTDHGTHVAGTIGARGNNGVGVAGVAWQASVMPVRALNASGSGSNADIADAFTYAAANGAKVVNASLGGPANSQLMSNAITSHPNTLFVVSAGNLGQNNDTTPQYPCNYAAANLICVAATSNTDAQASFSNYGATSVDLAAPGVDIDSSRPHYISPDAFSDDFESGLGKWTVESGPWTTAAVIGSTWLVDSPGNYADNADWAIRTSALVDVAGRTDCVFKFRYGTFLQAGADWLDLQSSADGTAWTTLARIGDTNGAVRTAGLELGAAGSRYYRFRLTSDGSTAKNGIYIDNVRVACPGGPYGSDDYQFLSGTSMASPQVAGAAAVLYSAQPSATVAEVRAALLETGDPVAALSGRTVTGRRLNLDAALKSPAVRADTTTTVLSDDPDPSVVGQAVTVRYRVAADAPGAAGTPAGNVTVSDGAASCTGTVAAGQCTLVVTTAGATSLTATYAGDDAYYNPSPASAGVAHQVDPAATTTTIGSDLPDPSGAGEPVTVSFTVAPVAPGAGTPGGSVTVSDGVDSCTAAAAAGSCDIGLTTGGERSLTAAYAGDGNFIASTSAGVPHTVNRLATTTTLTSDDPDPSVVGQPVVVRYSVSPGDVIGTPTGIVTVSDGTDSCTASADAGQCTLAFTSAGSKSLTATFAGDASFGPSTSAATSHAVGRAGTATTISADAPDPSILGEPVTVRYTVAPSAPGAGTPTGDVTVTDGVDSCTATAAAGGCSIALATVGDRALTARYTGDLDFLPSSSGGEPHGVGVTTSSPPPSAPPGPSPSPVPAPALPARISDASVTSRTFRVSPRPRLAQPSQSVGTTFRYTLDRPATVRFDFTQPRGGRTVRGRCVAPNRRNRGRPRCTRLRGSLAFAGRAGRNSVRFRGWLSRTKKLTPGAYRLIMTAITPGVGTTSQTLRFTIARSR
jgi:subtilisin family serine protease